jgi:hypothetical protein
LKTERFVEDTAVVTSQADVASPITIARSSLRLRRFGWRAHHAATALAFFARFAADFSL